MLKGTAEAHTALEALIIKAVYSKKTGTRSVALYLPELAKSYEKLDDESIELVVEITTYWSEPDLVEMMNQDPEGDES